MYFFRSHDLQSNADITNLNMINYSIKHRQKNVYVLSKLVQYFKIGSKYSHTEEPNSNVDILFTLTITIFMKLASKVNNIGIASRFYHICESSSRVNGTPLFCEVSTRQLSTWISFLYLSILAHYKIL